MFKNFWIVIGEKYLQKRETTVKGVKVIVYEEIGLESINKLAHH